jgi:hypothetical protein
MSSVTTANVRDYRKSFPVFLAYTSFGNEEVGNYISFAERKWISSDEFRRILWEYFSELVSAWKAETCILSAPDDIRSSIHLKQIMDMGREIAVPMIIRQLQIEGDNPYHWWWPLRTLVGENPVPVELRRDITQASRSWIDWGRKRYGRKVENF